MFVVLHGDRKKLKLPICEQGWLNRINFLLEKGQGSMLVFVEEAVQLSYLGVSPIGVEFRGGDLETWIPGPAARNLAANLKQLSDRFPSPGSGVLKLRVTDLEGEHPC
ncbi:unnamed protein product [Pieris macdunnoughi]|uniref:Uncharacterized protein n=1 Tax=Pieris macdunnoughi TaxID=345717 RepID=A0A821Y2Z8_9NEOP|nr:unnamed protein product [Pieris macdunnoughi]